MLLPCSFLLAYYAASAHWLRRPSADLAQRTRLRARLLLQLCASIALCGSDAKAQGVPRSIIVVSPANAPHAAELSRRLSEARPPVIATMLSPTEDMPHDLSPAEAYRDEAKRHVATFAMPSAYEAAERGIASIGAEVTPQAIALLSDLVLLQGMSQLRANPSEARSLFRLAGNLRSGPFDPAIVRPEVIEANKAVTPPVAVNLATNWTWWIDGRLVLGPRVTLVQGLHHIVVGGDAWLATAHRIEVLPSTTTLDIAPPAAPIALQLQRAAAHAMDGNPEGFAKISTLTGQQEVLVVKSSVTIERWRDGRLLDVAFSMNDAYAWYSATKRRPRAAKWYTRRWVWAVAAGIVAGGTGWVLWADDSAAPRAVTIGGF